MDKDRETQLDSSFTSDTSASMSASSSGDVTSGEEGVVEQVTTAVSDTVQNVTDTVSNQVSKVTDTVSSQVDKVTNTAADKVEQLADTIAPATMDADAPKVQRQVVGTTVNILDRTAEYLREGNVDVVLEDLRNSVRRHPLRTLALGLGIGMWARGRFFPAPKPTGSSGRHSTQGRQPYSPPRSIPVYAAPTTTDYGADYGYADTQTSNVALSGIQGATSGTLGNAALADSLLYGADADTIGSIPSGSALDTAATPLVTSGLTSDTFGDTLTDTSSSSSTLGSDFDMGGSTGGSDLDMGGSTSGTGFDAGLGGTSGTDLDLGLGDSTLGSGLGTDISGTGFGTDTAATGDLDDVPTGTMESSLGDGGFAGSGQFDQNSDASNTDLSSGGILGSSDVLKRWDDNTRNQS